MQFTLAVSTITHRPGVLLQEPAEQRPESVDHLAASVGRGTGVALQCAWMRGPQKPFLRPWLRLEALQKLGSHRTGLAGLEPTTYGLGNRRSIRLSYSPTAELVLSAPPLSAALMASGAMMGLKAGEVIAIRGLAGLRAASASG